MITCTFENGTKASLRHVVVHAIVESDDKLLLVKRAATLSLEPNKWALPGGFVDCDETAAQAVLRELLEETGWEGKVISLFRINTNPNRPHEDRQNIAFDFLVKPLAQTGHSDQESSKVDWVPIDTLPPLSSLAFDHGQSIQYFLTYRANSFVLPIVD